MRSAGPSHPDIIFEFVRTKIPSQKHGNNGKNVIDLDVSENRGTPKWMVYNGKPLLKWMIWGHHYFRKHPFVCFVYKTIYEILHLDQKFTRFGPFFFSNFLRTRNMPRIVFFSVLCYMLLYDP